MEWRTFLISDFRRDLNIVYFLLGISPASNCSWPTFRNPVSVPSHCTPSLWRWNWYRVPKRRPTTIWRRGNTQKKTYNIQITAKVWNQECMFIFAQSDRRIKTPHYGAVWVYGTKVNDPSVGSVMFSRIMNSTYLIPIEWVWLECINFGLTMKSSGDSVRRHSPITLED